MAKQEWLVRLGKKTSWQPLHSIYSISFGRICKALKEVFVLIAGSAYLLFGAICEDETCECWLCGSGILCHFVSHPSSGILYMEAVGRTTEQLTIATRFGGFEHWINWICPGLFGMIPNWLKKNQEIETTNQITSVYMCTNHCWT